MKSKQKKECLEMEWHPVFVSSFFGFIQCCGLLFGALTFPDDAKWNSSDTIAQNRFAISINTIVSNQRSAN
jgi:hypothetical protein